MPQAVPPGEVTYQVHVIANSVDPKCTVTYNTSNAGYDELCQLPSANISVASFTNATFDNMTINTANIGATTINVANIQTANILNATIMYGYVGSDPTSNLGIATKHYVDAAMANVPTGGSDLQNIIDAKGDLLVGTGFHTAARLPVGTAGQILTSDSSANVGVKWITITGVMTFQGLWVRTHHTPSLRYSQVLLRHADECLMDDGSVIYDWNDLSADIRVSGAGGLDVGTQRPSRWYEVYAIRDSSNGTQNLLLHEASDIVQDASNSTISDLGPTIRKVTSSSTKAAQSFVAGNTGPLTSAELEISKTGSPTGLIWVTVEADTAGEPSGTALATSRVMDVSRLPTDKARVRFIFDTNTSVTMGTSYFLVYQGDYTLSDANYTTWWGMIAGGYADGIAKEFRGGWVTCLAFTGNQDLWFKTFIESTPVTAVTMPTGYDQKCLISYVYNNHINNFKQYQQLNRTIVLGYSVDWKAFTPVTGLVEAIDLRSIVPPPGATIQFHLKQAGTTLFAVPIGGIESTDMPTGEGTADGIISANLRPQVFNFPGATVGATAEIAVENQVLLTRMQNTAISLLYAAMLRI